jgi:hypothetical protein
MINREILLSRSSFLHQKATCRWQAGCAAATLALLLFGGCQQSDSIASYRVPRKFVEDERQAEKAGATAPNAGGSMASAPAGGRMLAAIVGHGSQAWFFKMSGPPAAVGQKADEFISLIRSIQFAAGDDAPAQWTLPEGWREQGKAGLRENTLITSGEPLDVSVTKLPKSPGDDDGYALANINRWRGQLKLAPITAAEMAGQTTKVTLADGVAIVVDLKADDDTSAEKAVASAPGKPPVDHADAGAASDRMLAAILIAGQQAWFFKLTGPADAVTARDAQFQEFLKSFELTAGADGKPKWKLPEGWREQAAGGVRYATLLIGAGEKPLDLSVTVLQTPPGDEADYLLSNINRWRSQMQLPPVGKESLSKETSSVDTAAGKAVVVNLLGKAAPDGMQRGPSSGGTR